MAWKFEFRAEVEPAMSLMTTMKKKNAQRGFWLETAPPPPARERLRGFSKGPNASALVIGPFSWITQRWERGRLVLHTELRPVTEEKATT